MSVALNGAMGDARASRRRRLTTGTAAGFLVGALLFVLGVPLSLDTALSPVVGAGAFFVGALLLLPEAGHADAISLSPAAHAAGSP